MVAGSAGDEGRDAPGAGGLSRRRLLQGGVVVAGGAAVGVTGAAALVDPAGAATTAPKVVGACATVLSSVTAAVCTSAAARVKVRSWPVARPSQVTETAWVATNAATTAKVPLPSIPVTGEAWAWRAVVAPPGSTSPTTTDVVRTLPARPAAGAAGAFTFAFGSCLLGAPSNPALRVARAAAPQFFALIGDMGYQDNPARYPTLQNYGGYVALFRRILGGTDFAALVRDVPLHAMQDDHDYGKDDCDRTTVKAYAAQAYTDVLPGPGYPGPSYRRWSVGDCDFFLTDNRRYRDPAGSFENGRYLSTLGTAQRTWLLDGLRASRAAVKFVFLPMTMGFYWSKGEREEVLAAIAAGVSGTVLFLSGDKHASAVFEYAPHTWELLASPIANPTKHKTPSRPGLIWTENGAGPALSDCVGVVDVDTRPSARKVTLRIVRADGSLLHRQVVHL
jgi:phosphodiesterase/alkaline phosphatase D-like protein